MDPHDHRLKGQGKCLSGTMASLKRRHTVDIFATSHVGMVIGLIAFLLAAVRISGTSGQAAPMALNNHAYLPLLTRSGPASIGNGLGYGASVANLANTAMVRDIGFGWLKAQLKWSSVQPVEGGALNWGDLDNIIAAGRANSLNILLRVDGAPVWTHPGNNEASAPPDAAHLAHWTAFNTAVANRAGASVQVYEVWNEPNLAWEWGNCSPSPGEYVQILQAAYTGIKSGYPPAVVVSAGLATTGGDGGGTAMDDVAFLRAMYAAGAKGSFDALGSHPYGFASSPDQFNPNGILQFRRVADQRQVMVENGDSAKQVWATEFGWLLNSSCNWPDRNWQKVSESDQADFTVRAFQIARTEWPWMAGMLVFNLDFATVPWYDACEPMRYYSMLSTPTSPRAVYGALRNMAK